MLAGACVPLHLLGVHALGPMLHDSTLYPKTDVHKDLPCRKSMLPVSQQQEAPITAAHRRRPGGQTTLPLTLTQALSTVARRLCICLCMEPSTQQTLLSTLCTATWGVPRGTFP